jgi:hypothetical protein
MSIRLLILFFGLFLIGQFAFSQVDRREEGFNIRPSDSILKTDLSLSFKLSPIKGLTNKNIQPRINYTPMVDSFKKKSGIDITATSTLKKPTWDVKQKFTEDYRNVSEFSKDYNLGNVSTGSKTVILQCRDHEYVDGDRIKLMVNNAVIHPNITLRGDFYSIDIDLKEGVNSIDFVALNEGSSRPNTAQLRVFDENGTLLSSNKWLITTGFKASLTVYKQ